MIYLNPALEKENQDLEAPAVSSRKQEAATTGHTSNPTKKKLEQEDSLCTTTTLSKAAATIKPLLNGDTMHLTEVNNEDESNPASAAVKLLQTKSLNGLDPPGLTNNNKHRQAAA